VQKGYKTFKIDCFLHLNPHIFIKTIQVLECAVDTEHVQPSIVG
jgi:hypothetical protein